MKVQGQLEKAQLENSSSDLALSARGLIYWNTTDLRARFYNGTSWVSLLANDAKCVIGTNGTAASNVRLHRGGAGIIQFVTADDATAEGTLSNSMAQVGHRLTNYALASRPTAAAANEGRIIWVSDSNVAQIDNGGSWVELVDLTSTQTLTAKKLGDTGGGLFGFQSRFVQLNTDAASNSTAAAGINPKNNNGYMQLLGGQDSPFTYGAVYLYGGSHATKPGYVEIQSGSVVWRWPTADGTSGQVMQTNGSGVLSFVSAASSLAYAAKTANYTLTSTDDVIAGATSGGAFTLTLPTAVGISGKVYEVIKTDTSTNGLTIDGNSTETIGGATTQILYGQFEAMRFISDGANWQILQWRKPSVAFFAHRNSVNQSIGNGSNTKVEFTTETFDVGGYFDNATNYRFTPRVPGKYILTFSAMFNAAVDTSVVNLMIYKNGSAITSARGHASTTKEIGGNVSVIVDANGTTDYFEAYIFQDSGSSQNLAGTSEHTNFSGALLF